MHRFFVNPAAIGDSHIQLDPDTLQHIRVLRFEPKERFIVSDGAGIDYCCVLAGEQAEILERFQNRAEPTARCTVYLGFTRGERMDYAVQKSVELGASALRLFPAARCVTRYDEKGLAKKLVRWEKIALEAAKQSGRGMVPAVTAMPDFRSAILEAAQADCPLFFYEHETRQSLPSALERRRGFRSASLIIGPEGGFTEAEAAWADACGLDSVSLGARILRAETAPVAALAALMFYTGDMG